MHFIYLSTLEQDIEKNTPEQALNRLQRICCRQEKCADDVQKKLQQWEIAPAVAEIILRQLQSGNFVNDLRYAKAFVHDKFELSGWGLLKIRNALYLKKIKEEIIQEALSGIDNMAATRKLEQLLKLKNKSLKAVSTTDRKVKLLRFAVSRGYDYQSAYEVASKITDKQ